MRDPPLTSVSVVIHLSLMVNPITPRFLTESLKLPSGSPTRSQAERHIVSKLRYHSGNVSLAADGMKVGRATLNRWITSNAYIAHALKGIRREFPSADPPAGNDRRSVDVGPFLDQVSPVSYWYQQGHFRNEDEARGAFRLAYQQGLDGMGKSIPDWMGITGADFDAWVRTNALPPIRTARKTARR